MIIAILQARVSSSRLPGKVLKNLFGKPMIQRQLERLERSKKIDKLIIATSTDPSDDELADFCNSIQVDCFRGSLHDVLDRYYQAALKYQPDHIVRLTGDCPLHDPGLIDIMINKYLSEKPDYLCNTVNPTFPDGLDTWVFTFSALQRSWKNAVLPSEREHVVMYIKNHPELFDILSYENNQDLSRLRWTVDEPEDFEFVEAVYNALYNSNKKFSTKDILNLLDENPGLLKINNKFIRDEGLLKSLLEDKKLGHQ